VLLQLCSSGVPPDAGAQLEAATQAGLRTLALAHRTLPAGTSAHDLASLGPEALEAGLAFGGLALFENALKPDSAEAVASLRGAAMKVGGARFRWTRRRRGPCSRQQCGGVL
jgi:magnesium-transporting ATPase (P-type)